MFNKVNVECGTMCVTVVSTVVLCYMDRKDAMFGICTAYVVQKYNDDLWNLSQSVCMLIARSNTCMRQLLTIFVQFHRCACFSSDT